MNSDSVSKPDEALRLMLLIFLQTFTFNNSCSSLAIVQKRKNNSKFGHPASVFKGSYISGNFKPKMANKTVL